MVPGSGQQHRGSDSCVTGRDAAINLYDRSAGRRSRVVDMSVIAWMGYDAPDGFNDQRIGAPLAGTRGRFAAGPRCQRLSG